MAEELDPKKLVELSDKIAAASKPAERKVKKADKYTGASQAWQMVVELTVGMVIGVLIGIGLDYMTGLQPLFIIIFSMLGFGAGVRVMMQTAQAHQKANEARALRDKNGA
ncbi:MAG: AtpZ/AtpI family protein [Rhodobacteraceae bacterium]|nr:AtpZ/AtpI family protein [Paracoccaceae bacterium]